MSIDDDAGELVAVAVTRLEEEDFVRAYREVPSLRAMIWMPLVSLGLASVVGIALFAISGTATGASLGAVAIGWLAVVGAIAFFRMRIPRQQWRALPEHARQARYEVRRHRFRTRTERAALDLSYEDFYGSLETNDAFYLEQQPANYIIVPKNAFESARDVDAAREIFAQKILRRAPKSPRVPGLVKTILLWALLVGLFALIYTLVES